MPHPRKTKHRLAVLDCSSAAGKLFQLEKREITKRTEPGFVETVDPTESDGCGEAKGCSPHMLPADISMEEKKKNEQRFCTFSRIPETEGGRARLGHRLNMGKVSSRMLARTMGMGKIVHRFLRRRSSGYRLLSFSNSCH